MKTMPSQCGYIAIVGRPNVGKSTLLNAILGKKISITTPKPQTTRTQILGIKSQDAYQIVFIDTPGLHDANQNAMNRYMNRMASAVIKDADAIIFMIDATRWTKDDELVLQKLQYAEQPVILALNKIDLVKDKNSLLPLIDKIKEKRDFAEILPLSAKSKDNILTLESSLIKYLPEGPHLFPDEQVTDKTERFQIAELIREKLIKATEQELPYSTSIEIERIEEQERFIEIHALIWVERDGQKAIVIGTNGSVLKRIGTQARKDIQNLLNRKVVLRLWVKVKDNWTDDDRALRSLGYE